MGGHTHFPHFAAPDVAQVAFEPEDGDTLHVGVPNLRNRFASFTVVREAVPKNRFPVWSRSRWDTELARRFVRILRNLFRAVGPHRTVHSYSLAVRSSTLYSSRSSGAACLHVSMGWSSPTSIENNQFLPRQVVATVPRMRMPSPAAWAAPLQKKEHVQRCLVF